MTSICVEATFPQKIASLINEFAISRYLIIREIKANIQGRSLGLIYFVGLCSTEMKPERVSCIYGNGDKDTVAITDRFVTSSP